jgi:tRNA threonylcarbamoyladenosine biosynthesis protein TsaB
VGDETGILAEVILRVGAGASSSLMPAVDYALERSGLRPEDLRALVVGGGPGSFTGLRVAAATAKGAVFALGVPLLAFSGLLAAAVAGSGARGDVCALFDARRRDVYAARYRFGREGTGTGEQGSGTDEETGRRAMVETVMEPRAVALEALLEEIRGEPPLFVGEGAVLHREEIERATGAAVGSPLLGLPRASALLWLAAHHPEGGRVADPSAWEPTYVRAAGAERIAGERTPGDGA